ncbi:MAG: YihY/virulence factor BrkB family protein [Psychroserpens sp.]|uniref:YihY/virulence factor BrkB family protein n=1 Tax=Psychroserpens sp. TaxID=2020870 RepID=UPI003C77F4A3
MEKSTKKAKFKFKDLPQLLLDSYKSWDGNDPWRMSAVVAYYAVLSLPGLLIIIMNVVGRIWGRDIVQGKLSNRLASILGSDSAETIKSMISQTLDTESNLISTIIGIATILFGATGVFYQLQISLNKIWKVETISKFSFKKILTDRARSFAFILVIGFLLLISFVLTTIISALTDWIKVSFPDVVLYVIYLVNLMISIGIISTLFALMFRFMPDTKIRWKTVWIGAILTAVLFVLGEFLLGVYFGRSNPASTYGAAGSIVLVLLWVSYSCLIFFFGAEFTRQYSMKYGHDSHTYKNAVEDLVEKGEV